MCVMLVQSSCGVGSRDPVGMQMPLSFRREGCDFPQVPLKLLLTRIQHTTLNWTSLAASTTAQTQNN